MDKCHSNNKEYYVVSLELEEKYLPMHEVLDRHIFYRFAIFLRFTIYMRIQYQEKIYILPLHISQTLNVSAYVYSYLFFSVSFTREKISIYLIEMRFILRAS